MEKLLEIKDLHVQYDTEDGRVYAVNGMNLSIKKGETLGLVGETGAGKTTTALSILKLLPEQTASIERGSIYFNGENIISLSEPNMRKLRGNMISMIFQDPMSSLNPIIPVGKQIEEALLLHTNFTKDERASRVDEMLEAVGLQASRKNEYPHQFSGGMRQRIAIAMALACDPQLLLADEPTTALDVTIQAQVLQMMNELKKKFNTSMILITHDLGVVAQTCDKVSIMYAGKVVESGTIKDIFEGEHHHPYSEGLFKSIPLIDEDVDRLSPIPGMMPDPMVQTTGCNFSDRCPYRMERCLIKQPNNYIKKSHMISCYLYEDLLDFVDKKKEEVHHE